MGEHYVPQYYLRGFTSGGKRLWAYDKAERRAFSTQVKSIANETGLYGPEVERQLAEKIEEPANKVLGRIRDRAPLVEGDKTMLAAYMLCMLQRVPEDKERISQLAPDLFQDIVQGVEKRIDALEREHPDQADVCVLRRAELANLPDGFAEDLTHPAWLDSISPASYPQVVAVLGRMRWQFLTVDGQAAFLAARLKLLVCEHQFRDQLRRFLLHCRDGDDLGVHAGLQRQGGVGVSAAHVC